MNRQDRLHVQQDMRIKNALQKAKLKFPRWPRVVGVPRYEVGVDSTGDDAIYVWVILEHVTAAEISSKWSAFRKIEDAIREALTQRWLTPGRTSTSARRLSRTRSMQAES